MASGDPASREVSLFISGGKAYNRLSNLLDRRVEIDGNRRGEEVQSEFLGNVRSGRVPCGWVRNGRSDLIPDESQRRRG
jgi:hypothetical protein